MAQVEVQINGRSYKITCENGQETRLQQLANYLNRHVVEIAEDLGQIGDARLMLLSALTVCDELFETKARLKEMSEGGPGPDTSDAARKVIEAAAGRVADLNARLAEAS